VFWDELVHFTLKQKIALRSYEVGGGQFIQIDFALLKSPWRLPANAFGNGVDQGYWENGKIRCSITLDRLEAETPPEPSSSLFGPRTEHDLSYATPNTGVTVLADVAKIAQDKLLLTNDASGLQCTGIAVTSSLPNCIPPLIRVT